MSPAAGTALLRWSDEEHDILVQMTNDQLELEAQDRTKVISWTKHWKRVSVRLQDHDYSRTPTACRGYWKRGIEAQLATEQAAGPRWDDSEHQILLGMTEDQLELEKSDPSAVISWARHWEKVSSQLQEKGYARSRDACDAYWILLQNTPDRHFLSTSGNDGDERDWEAHGSIDDEEYPPVALGATSTQQSTKVHQWTDDEHENLLEILKSRRILEENQGMEQLSGFKLWTIVSQLHQESGFDRTWEACKTYWHDKGRSRSGFDERPNSGSCLGTGSTRVQSRQSSHSSVWSPVNELEDNAAMSELTTPEGPRAGNFQKSKSQESQYTHTMSPNSTLLVTTAKLALVSNSAPSADLSPAQDKQEWSTNPNIPPHPPGHPDAEASAQSRYRGFRFKPDQRAFLVDDAAKNGTSPGILRREDLATQLGVEEKTIRNWFVHYRNTRKSEGTVILNGEKTAISNEADAPTSNKRPFDSVRATRRQGSVQSPSKSHPSKRIRVADTCGDKPENMNHISPLESEVPQRHFPTEFEITCEESFSVGTDKEQGVSHQEIPSEPDHQPHTPVNGLPQGTVGTGFRAVFTNRMEIGNLLSEKLLEPELSTMAGPGQQTSGHANQFETVPQIPSSPKLIQDNNIPKTTSIMDSDFRENSSNSPNGAAKTQTTSTLLSEEDPRTYASKHLQRFQAEIRTLNHETSARALRIASIEQVIQDVQTEQDKSSHDKREEIARVLAEIEERYNRKHDLLKDKLVAQTQLKQRELDESKKAELEISRKEIGMKRFQALIDYFETDDDHISLQS